MKHLNIHCLQHVPFETPAGLERWAQSRGHALSVTHLYVKEALPALSALDWLVVLGGPMGALEEATYGWLRAEKQFVEEAIVQHKIVIGICLGAQIIADVLGARVYAHRCREIGWYPIYPTAESRESPLASRVTQAEEVFHWHGDTFDLPDGAIHLARSAACAHQAFSYQDHVLALQYHLETTRSSLGDLIAHCAGEIVPGPTVQTAEAMLARPERFDALYGLLQQALDGLAQAGSKNPHHPEDPEA
jgi:GMP synthase (glutamine-hydrolysing)